MILGGDKAGVAVNNGEQPLQASYPVNIDGKTYNLHDTIGLGEHTRNVNSAKAAGNLYRLVADLSNRGGINLLVYVIKSNKPSAETLRKNYNLLHHGFCNSKVPIVIVVTGCENLEPTMDTWWVDNEASLTQAGMSFKGYACVCAFRGTKTRNGGYRNEDLVEDSVNVLRQLVVQHCRSNGWKRVQHPYSQFSTEQN